MLEDEGERNSGQLHDFFHSLVESTTGRVFEINELGVPINIRNEMIRDRADKVLGVLPDAVRLEEDGTILWVKEGMREEDFGIIYDYILDGKIPQSSLLDKNQNN